MLQHPEYISKHCARFILPDRKSSMPAENISSTALREITNMIYHLSLLRCKETHNFAWSEFMKYILQSTTFSDFLCFDKGNTSLHHTSTEKIEIFLSLPLEKMLYDQPWAFKRTPLQVLQITFKRNSKWPLLHTQISTGRLKPLTIWKCRQQNWSIKTLSF